MSSTPTTDHTPKHPANRLAGSSSPYLRQHAHNPVDWWPWGPEAIAEARRRDVPIFLSVGYSTCYWCHVMERESFEDERTAKVLGERFVSVKVDREERPDIDEIYMAAVQMLTGSGGWPMSVFLDPHTLRPFWGGTYFPPVPAHGRPSFSQVLTRMSEVFSTQRAEVLAQAEQVGKAVAERLGASASPLAVGSAQVTRASETLLTIVDRTNGGFGGAPKFPQPVYLDFAIDAIEHARAQGTTASGGEGNIKALHQVVRQTLIAMAIGGIHDHVGGGFHRYSVDATWTVPHFEKMLYDNGLLLSVFARAAAAEDHPATAALFRSVCERLVAYIEREMTATGGLLWSAQDAEVDGREGKNYVWTADEVSAALGGSPEHLDFALRAFGVDKGPNFQDPHHPGEPATCVLRLAAAPNALAAEMGLSLQRFTELYEQSTRMLLAVRNTRKQPRLDDKVITSWNAMMIEGLATAGKALDKPDWIAKARGMVDVLCAQRTTNHGLLRRLDRSGPGEVLLEDQAYVLRALLACSVATGAAGTNEARSLAATLLKRAHKLAGAIDEHFASNSGGFFDTLADRTDLFVRACQTYDGAVPSSVGVMFGSWVQLALLTGEEAILGRTLRCLASLSPAIAESPVGSINSTRALAELMRYHSADVAGHFAALATAGGGSAGAGAGAAPRDGRDVVGISISTEELVLSESEPAEFFLRLEIAPGYHINSAFAAEQSGGAVVALRADIIGGEGVRIYGDYPEGETVDGLPYTVHTGQLDLRLVVEVEPGADEKLERTIVLQFQACRDDACLVPSRLALPIRLVFGRGESVE